MHVTLHASIRLRKSFDCLPVLSDRGLTSVSIHIRKQGILHFLGSIHTGITGLRFRLRLVFGCFPKVGQMRCFEYRHLLPVDVGKDRSGRCGSGERFVFSGLYKHETLYTLNTIAEGSTQVRCNKALDIGTIDILAFRAPLLERKCVSNKDSCMSRNSVQINFPFFNFIQMLRNRNGVPGKNVSGKGNTGIQVM